MEYEPFPSDYEATQSFENSGIVQSDQWIAFLEICLQNAPCSVLLTDSGGNIRYVNEAFQETTGYRLEEVVGRNPRFLKSGRQSESVYRVMWQTLSSGQSWHGEFVNRRKDGSLIHEEMTILPLPGPKGKTHYYLALKTDRSRQHELEGQVLQAQKVEAIGNLACGLTHDFKNIINLICGFGELALNQVDPDSKAAEILRRIPHCRVRANELVNRLLLLRHRGEEKFEPVPLGLFIRDSANLLPRTLIGKTELRCTISPRDYPVLANPIQIQQMLINLLINACQAMGEDGGLLELSWDPVHVTEEMAERHIDLRPGRYMLLVVRDTGPGIPRELLDRIFDPYFTTKSNEDGSGLGLAMVQAIAHTHGGAVLVDSEPGRGSCFEVFLPTVPDEA